MEEFVAVLVEIVFRASRIALVLRQSDAFQTLIEEKTSEHGKNERFAQDFKTLADVLIQEVVKYNLMVTFQVDPTCVQGEEDSTITLSSGETVHMTVGPLFENTVDLLERVFKCKELSARLADIIHSEATGPKPSSDELAPLKEVEIDWSDLGIWIDPIDGTNEYIKGGNGRYADGISEGGLPVSTVLVGAYSKTTGVPFAGFVGFPFDPESNLKAERIRTVWGVAHKGCTAVSQSLLQRSNPNTGVVVMSASESSEVKTACEATGRGIRYAAGSGYKLMRVVEGAADAYVLSKPSSFKWDTCAPHAILRALGGDVVDRKGVSIVYNQPNKGDGDVWCNGEGVLAFANPNDLPELLQIISA